MTTVRKFIAQGDWTGGIEVILVLELESSGRVSWRLWQDRQDNGGDTSDQRGRETFEQVAAQYSASDLWREV